MSLLCVAGPQNGTGTATPRWPPADAVPFSHHRRRNLHDYRGTLLADETQARAHANEMLTSVARAKRLDTQPKFIKVTDEDGGEVFRVSVPFENA